MIILIEAANASDNPKNILQHSASLEYSQFRLLRNHKF